MGITMAKSKFKFYKKKDDVKFIDPKTMQVVCTWNQCFHKFTVKTEVEVNKSYSGFSSKTWNQYRTECEECGRQVKCSADIEKSIQSWHHSTSDTMLAEQKQQEDEDFRNL